MCVALAGFFSAKTAIRLLPVYTRVLKLCLFWSSETKVSNKTDRVSKLTLPASDSEESRTYLRQKLQDKVLKFRTSLSPARLLKVIKEATRKVSSEYL